MLIGKDQSAVLTSAPQRSPGRSAAQPLPHWLSSLGQQNPREAARTLASWLGADQTNRFGYSSCTQVTAAMALRTSFRSWHLPKCVCQPSPFPHPLPLWAPAPLGPCPPKALTVHSCGSNLPKGTPSPLNFRVPWEALWRGPPAVPVCGVGMEEEEEDAWRSQGQHRLQLHGHTCYQCPPRAPQNCFKFILLCNQQWPLQRPKPLPGPTGPHESWLLSTLQPLFS